MVRVGNRRPETLNKDVDEKIYQFVYAEILKEFTIAMLELLNKYESKEDVKPEEVLKWALEITLRESEIAIKVGKHAYFQEIRQKLNESLNIFDKANFKHVTNSIRDALTKATSIGAISHENLCKK